jgi:hypothetical protein
MGYTPHVKHEDPVGKTTGELNTKGIILGF